MKILSVSIENFRSIRDKVIIPFEAIANRSCFVLLGINESGKSNILHAIALLDSGELNYEEDCHKDAQEEGEEATVSFQLEVDDVAALRARLIEGGINKDLAGKIKFLNISKCIGVDPDGDSLDYYLISIKEDKAFQKYLVVGDVIVPRTTALETKDADGQVTNVLSAEVLEGKLELMLEDFLNEQLPEVIFWRPLNEKYLISTTINLTEFKENPDSCIPLRNCFRIAGIKTDELIKKKIESLSGRPSKVLELQERLSQSVTEHINEKWKEHNVTVKFLIDNLQLSFLVEDNDAHVPKYAVQQRSDGFRHFVSLLLNISAENKAQLLENKIILLDEPEVHLHPSGQRYLRDELLEIAKRNIVFFATHSIYMVDTKNIDRHFSIKKSKGCTTVTATEKDDPYREEVLYEALGTSVLQLIEPNVLIFEGKTDRDIFELYKRKFKVELASQKVSCISADGCKNVIRYTKFFNTKLVKGYVLLDSDLEGVEQRLLILKEPGYNVKNTFEINDIVATGKKSTLEDLFDKSFLEDAVKKHFDLDIDLDVNVPLIEQVKKKLAEHQKPYKEQEKMALRSLFFDNVSKLGKDELKKQLYFKFVKGLSSKIKD